MKFGLFIIFNMMTLFLFAKNKTIKLSFLDSGATIIAYKHSGNNCNKPCPVFSIFRKKQKLNKRITAAVLAFPVPFGIVGLHRIYLGTKPHVPVAYIASLGGVFGILPLIDFFAITCDKNFDHYRDNGKVFMWVKE